MFSVIYTVNYMLRNALDWVQHQPGWKEWRWGALTLLSGQPSQLSTWTTVKNMTPRHPSQEKGMPLFILVKILPVSKCGINGWVIQSQQGPFTSMEVYPTLKEIPTMETSSSSLTKSYVNTNIPNGYYCILGQKILMTSLLKIWLKKSI